MNPRGSWNVIFNQQMYLRPISGTKEWINSLCGIFEIFFENSNRIELLNCYIRNLQRAVTLTKRIKGTQTKRNSIFPKSIKKLWDFTRNEREEYFMYISKLRLSVS